MGHAVKGKKNARRFGIAEIRKTVEDEGFALGYGTTSVYHLEELYGKILSLSAKVKVLETCREELSALVQEQEKETIKMARPKNDNKRKSAIALVIAIAAAGTFLVARPESKRYVIATPPYDSREVFTVIDTNTIPGWIEITPGVYQENPDGDKYVRQDLDGGMWQGDIFRTATPSATSSITPPPTVTSTPTITLTPSLTPLVPVIYTLTFTPTAAPSVVSQIPFFVEVLVDKLSIYGYASCAGAVKGNLAKHGTIEILEVTSHNGKDYCGKIGNKLFIPLVVGGVSFTSWSYGEE